MAAIRSQPLVIPRTSWTRQRFGDCYFINAIYMMTYEEQHGHVVQSSVRYLCSFYGWPDNVRELVSFSQLQLRGEFWLLDRSVSATACPVILRSE
jgi:transcriptional regulator with GAF, ATPase, and Fis domain